MNVSYSKFVHLLDIASRVTLMTCGRVSALC